MSETPGTELASEYSARIAQDLEVNAQEQDRLATEIAALEEQLRAVRENRVVLERLQQALIPQSAASASLSVPAPATPDADTDAVVPHQRTEPAPGRREVAKPVPAETKPSLVEAVHAYLAEQREPRSATDVAEAIRTAQPGRTIKTTVIRTTLENLVARNRARRTKQGRAVFYTVVTPEAGA
ncbi:hypothetical protein [Streptomyces sp. NPDC001833]|uniref:hypothetical protein n=1 Tax=Streptomyces sp. NPDC001833 TaxID=3154658 RepID=UPI003320C66A